MGIRKYLLNLNSYNAPSHLSLLCMQQMLDLLTKSSEHSFCFSHSTYILLWCMLILFFKKLCLTRLQAMWSTPAEFLRIRQTHLSLRCNFILAKTCALNCKITVMPHVVVVRTKWKMHIKYLVQFKPLTNDGLHYWPRYCILLILCPGATRCFVCLMLNLHLLSSASYYPWVL